MKVDYNLYPGRDRKAKIDFDRKEPIVSIVTPYYNTNKYIDTTVNSVLNQTFPYFEWIIIDDGSTNKEDIEKLNTIEKLDERIRVFHKENEGPAAARDFGVEKISHSSKYIVFLDSDDLLNETYIECAYWTLETNKEASWTYTDTINFGGENFTWVKWYNPRKELKENLLVMTAMIRKEAFLKVNGFEIRDKNVYEDWCLWLKMIKLGMYPVRMSFYGFWYRKKAQEESELQQSNNENREKAMSYVRQVTNEIEKIIKKDQKFIKKGIQYPKEDYNWEYIKDKNDSVIVPKKQKNNKINILLIIPWMTVGGADKFNLDIIKRISKDKYEFTVISTEPNSNDWRQMFEEYATVYDLTTFLDKQHWISFINYIIEKNNIDIIFNTNSTFGYGIIPYLKVKYPEKPIMDYIHMEEWYNRNGGFSRDSSRISSFIDKTYVCNKNSEKILINYFNRKPEDIETIYIGVDEKVYNPELFNKEDILKQLNIEKKGKYIISYICRIAHQKRPYLLLKIIEKIKSQRKDCLFIIAGDGPLLDKIKQEAKRLKIYKDIIFLGNVKETEKIYVISDITINCSIKEGLALTAYESLAMGVPVVSCDVGGQKELINEKVGIIVPCMQKEEDIHDYKYKEEEITPYAEGINKILNNLENYKNNARPRVLKGFTIDNMIRNIDKAFETIRNNPNSTKIENAKNMQNNIDLTKEFITRYFIGAQIEYEWLAKKFNMENVDIDWKLEKKENKMLYYENTLEYKIKHPIYLALTKLHLYDLIKRILKRGE